MNYILLTIIVFIQLLYYLIIIDILLSWLNIFGLNFEIKFIKSILNPIYEKIKNTISTNFGPFELSPMILIIILILIQGLILAYDKEIFLVYNNLFKI